MCHMTYEGRFSFELYKNNSKIMIDLLIVCFSIDRLVYMLILLVIIYVIYFT